MILFERSLLVYKKFIRELKKKYKDQLHKIALPNRKDKNSK